MIDLASGGAFMDYSISQAWGLLDKIRFNQETWNLDKGGKGGVEHGFDCVKTFSQAGKVKDISGDYHVNIDIVLQIDH